MNVRCLRLGETVRYREGERDVSVCGKSGCLLGACEAAQVQSGSPDVDGKATQRAGHEGKFDLLGFNLLCLSVALSSGNGKKPRKFN